VAGPLDYTEIGAPGLRLDREKAVEVEGATSNVSRGSGWGVAVQRGRSTAAHCVAISGEESRVRESGEKRGKGAGNAPYHNAELLRRLLDGGTRQSVDDPELDIGGGAN
jgi:hypothetical protein